MMDIKDEQKSGKTQLEELFEDFKGDSKDYKVVIDWGEKQGNEVW